MTLQAKEGLSLLNGTEGMLAHLCLAVADLEVLLRTVDITCAMSVEALLGTDASFAERIQRLRPHAGQAAAAANLARLLAGSPIVASHRQSDHAVQDAYSLRCAPQVHGAARDALAYARGVCAVELASVTDNPVVFAGGATGDRTGEGAAAERSRPPTRPATGSPGAPSCPPATSTVSLWPTPPTSWLWPSPAWAGWSSGASTG